MAGRLAIDFGTSNTVVAVWDEERQEGVSLHIPEWSRPMQVDTAEPDQEPVWTIPSLIHYSPTGERWLGEQVISRNLTDAPGTFRWLKHYINLRSSVKLQVNGQKISYFDAGEEFLATILGFTLEERGTKDEEVAFTVPVEAFEHYEDWIARVAEKIGIRRFRLIDEASAAALGYGARLQPGMAYMIFDFGGGTLDVSVVLIEGGESDTAHRRCRVLGKAGEDFGGSRIDQWIYQDLLKRNGLDGTDEEVHGMSRALLSACERAKEELSFRHEAEISVTSLKSGRSIHTLLTRKDFEAVLESHGFFPRIHATIQRALNSALTKGYPEDQIRAVLMVGGCSFIPCVQTALRQRFGNERVHFSRPLDAVARGAASFVAGIDFYDHIQHDYAVRFWDSRACRYDYRVIVRRGTNYPSSDDVARLFIKATHDGQTHFGIPLFELGSQQSHIDDELELVTDPSGALRLVAVSPEDEERRSHFWMNEKDPTFLIADPPADTGDARFEIAFNIDGNKRLLISSRDLKTGRILRKNYPVVKLV
jgi:molecular chaperone DnaK